MEFNDLAAFISVARAGGFRDAARVGGVSASSLSIAVQRLETKLGLRLLNRTTRSVAPTEAGQRLIDTLTPLFGEMEAALDVLNGFRDTPTGTLKLNVPAHALWTFLPDILNGFLATYPDIRVEVVVEDGFVDLMKVGCDAGIRYDERLEQDMIAIPIGPRTEFFAAAASPAYLEQHGMPTHPREFLAHRCLRVQFAGGAMPMWEFTKDGETIRIDPPGPLLARPGSASELLIRSALAGVGVIFLFQEVLRPHLESGALEPILKDWWPSFSGPFLYYPGRRHLPAPLRAFVDYVKANGVPRSVA